MEKNIEFSQKIAIFRATELKDFRYNEVSKSEFAFLMYIYQSKKPVYQNLLKDYFHCTKVYISKVISSLENKKLVIRKEGETDKRFCFIIVTKKGKQVIEKYIDKYEKMTNYLFNELGQEKSEMFINLLDEINKILENYYKNIKEKINE